MYLCIRADKPNVYVAIWSEGKQLTASSWEAGKELSSQLLSVINKNCKELKINISGLSGLIVYEGPGSYTGLRISISTANAIAYSENIPIVGSTCGDWIEKGLVDIKSIKNFKPISPNYGGEVYTTKPKK